MIQMLNNRQRKTQWQKTLTLASKITIQVIIGYNLEYEKQAQLNALEENEWDEEYNKYYFSPYLNINELSYLADVLKNSAYTNILSTAQQEKLSSYICNAPPKKI